MSAQTVLYDLPGPRTRRRILVGSVVAGVLVLALLAVVGVRLADKGQFEAEKWSPLLNPGDEDFAAVWRLLGQGLRNTLVAAALAMVLSLAIGTAIGVGRLLLGRTTRIPLVAVVEVARGLPVVISIYLASRVLRDAGLDLDELWYLVIGLTFYNSVILAEIVRAGVAALPRGQSEAAYAIGLSRWRALRVVLLPQAFRAMLPALISQLVVILKDTSLVAVLGGYLELLRQSQLIVQNLNNPIQMYAVAGTIYILLNYALSRLAVLTERRLSRGSRGVQVAAEQAEARSELRTGA